MIEECAPQTLSKPDPKGLPGKAYILTLDPVFADDSVRSRQRFMGMNGFRVDPFLGVNGVKLYGTEYSFVFDPDTGQNLTYHKDPQTGDILFKDNPGFLTAGERGYRGTMRKLFAMLLSKNITGNVLVMDDDVLFHCKIFDRLKELLLEPRCGHHVASTSTDGGILLLGSAIWINGTYPDRGNYCGGWKLTDAELKRLKEAGKDPPMCFNMHRKTFGTFAVIYHSSVFQNIVDWLANAEAPLPFDHIFPVLSKAGHIVRAAYPPLAIQDVRHASSIDSSRRAQNDMTYRAKIHRWGNVEEFCDPKTSASIQL